ncbi:MAG: hypothetical protein QG596_1422 [Actinomycetota bacterium]|nr:hypothetical protein [Actinomycetota bacterium]
MALSVLANHSHDLRGSKIDLPVSGSLEYFVHDFTIGNLLQLSQQEFLE